MRYEDFRSEFMESLRDRYEDGVKIDLQEVTKNNGVVKEGINIYLPGDENIVPLIYLDQIFDLYRDGMGIDECVDWVVKLREESTASKNGIVDSIEVITKWELARDKVYPILVNTEMNQEMLDSVIHKEFLDLSIIYIVRLASEESGGITSAKITKNLFDMYGITVDELHEAAMTNLKSDRYRLVDMESIILQLVKDTDSEQMVQSIEPGRMYVLTNENKVYGASGLLDQRLLKENSNGHSFYVLPSSIHETIFVPDSEEISIEDLNSMVEEVNRTQLEEKDILSNHAYYYDGSIGELRIA